MAGGSTSKRKSQRRTRSRRDQKPNPTAQLTDDLLVEILVRVPYRSLRHCLCVCQRWGALISHPDNHTRLPQTLAGFFYPLPFDDDDSPALTPPARTPHGFDFLNVSGTGAPFIDPSFSFLPDRERERLKLVDCCNGLILCRTYRFADNLEFDYLVLNPATEKWVAIPVTRRWSDNLERVRLGFDPAVSPHFYVFEFQLVRDGHVLGVKIYSSATEAWIDKQSGWIREILLQMRLKSVFLDGVLYVIVTRCIIGAVDVKGETWRITEFPRSKGSAFYHTGPGFLGMSQGRLHLANDDDMVRDKLAIWVFEDKESELWTLKHTVRFEHLGVPKDEFGFYDFVVVAIHPDRNMVFFVCVSERILMSYDMDSREVSIIRNLGGSKILPLLPYVPLLSKSLPHGGNQ